MPNRNTRINKWQQIIKAENCEFYKRTLRQHLRLNKLGANVEFNLFEYIENFQQSKRFEFL
jgi:hypothetical protein